MKRRVNLIQTRIFFIFSQEKAFVNSADYFAQQPLIQICIIGISSTRPLQLHWPECPELAEMTVGQPYMWIQVAR